MRRRALQCGLRRIDQVWASVVVLLKGDKALARMFLNTPNDALARRTPIELVSRFVGFEPGKHDILSLNFRMLSLNDGVRRWKLGVLGILGERCTVTVQQIWK